MLSTHQFNNSKEDSRRNKAPRSNDKAHERESKETGNEDKNDEMSTLSFA